MIEIFVTDIKNKNQADKIANLITDNYADLKINFDFNETELSFPCGHTVLRVEGENINSNEIIATIINLGFHCEILEDKVCV